MACCHQATSHYLHQCWPTSLMPYGITALQRIKTRHIAQLIIKRTFCVLVMRNFIHIRYSYYFGDMIIPPPNEVEGGYTGFTLSVCPSVRPSVCRRHGFRSISQDCFGISISNFICMLMVAIGRSLLIFSDVTFKMAAWRPYWVFWFPDSNFTLALNINFKLQWYNTYVYG